MIFGSNITVDGAVKAFGKLGGGVQASSEGDAVLLGSDGKVPSSLQATDIDLSLDADSKILTVTVNGTSKTVDLSGIGGGMKQIKKNYTDYSTFASDLDNGNIPLGAEVYFSYYISASTYRTGHFYYMSSERANPGSYYRVTNNSGSLLGSININNDMNVASKEIMIDVLYWE